MKTISYSFLLSFLFWLIPFCVRIPMNFSYVEQPVSNVKQEKTVDQIQEAFSSKNSGKAFVLVFENNMKGCVINICGGFLLGVGTIINLAFNGFVMSDTFVNVYNSGFSIQNILKTTLPHSFELIALWLSGAIGFMIFYQLLLFMRDKDCFTKYFFKKIGILFIVVTCLILFAAYVETHISVNIL